MAGLVDEGGQVGLLKQPDADLPIGAELDEPALVFGLEELAVNLSKPLTGLGNQRLDGRVVGRRDVDALLPEVLLKLRQSLCQVSQSAALLAGHEHALATELAVDRIEKCHLGLAYVEPGLERNLTRLIEGHALLRHQRLLAHPPVVAVPELGISRPELPALILQPTALTQELSQRLAVDVTLLRDVPGSQPVDERVERSVHASPRLQDVRQGGDHTEPILLMQGGGVDAATLRQSVYGA